MTSIYILYSLDKTKPYENDGDGDKVFGWTSSREIARKWADSSGMHERRWFDDMKETSFEEMKRKLGLMGQ